MPPPSDPPAQLREVFDRQLRAALAALATAGDALAAGIAVPTVASSPDTRAALEMSVRNLTGESERIEQLRRSLTDQPAAARQPW